MRLSAWLSLITASVLFSGCAGSSLTMQRQAEPMATQYGRLQTGAYAMVNSLKNESEVYVSKANRSVAVDFQGQITASLDPQDFGNQYSEVRISLGPWDGKALQGPLKIEFQGDNFADRYVVSEGIQMQCDGQNGLLTYRGNAKAPLNGIEQMVGIQFYFELTPETKSACPALP